MSQFWVGLNSGNVPPSIATEYDTQVGNAVPSLNKLIIDGFDSNQLGGSPLLGLNNVNGIQTRGGVAGTGTANEVDIILTNRIHGTSTTTDGTSVIVVFSLSLGAIPANYLFEVSISAFNVTDSLGSSYKYFFPLRTDGIRPFTYGITSPIQNEEGAMSNVFVNLRGVISTNVIQLEVTGLAGKTIDWTAVCTYTLAS